MRTTEDLIQKRMNAYAITNAIDYFPARGQKPAEAIVKRHDAQHMRIIFSN